MTVGDKDCCAVKTCGHGEIWHPTCCQRRPHRFVKPLVIGEKVIIVGDRFYYNFEGDAQYPKDPKGWIQCSFSGIDGNNLIVKPRGFEKFIVSRIHPERFRLAKAAQKENETK